MFTGIIEKIGEIVEVKYQNSNITFKIKSEISKELKIDQSVAHNGVCLTVINCNDTWHEVTAIQETLDRTNLKTWKEGTKVNLERCTKVGDRLDGHIVQGHVDQTGIITQIIDNNGSWTYYIKYDTDSKHITVEKGSICVNGTSLTVVHSEDGLFSVSIIPYTYENTIFQYLKVNDEVNLEFDILGKYIAKLFSNRS